MLNPTEVKYRITDCFGRLHVGEVINALLISNDSGRGLIYHPKVTGECPSFEIAEKGSDDIWTTIAENAFVNDIGAAKSFEEQVFGKMFKWKRKFYTKKETGVCQRKPSKNTKR